MARYLFRLGRVSFRRRGSVLAAWLLVLAVLGGLAGGFGRSADAQLSIPGVESVTATELLADRFPAGTAGGAAARVVFAAPEGAKVTDGGVQGEIRRALSSAATAPQVAAVSDPFATGSVSADGRVAYATVSYRVQVDEITPAAQEALLAVADPARDAGLRVEFGGEATVAASEQSATEAIGVLVAMVVLAITFGSMLAAGLPLLTALIGVGAGMAGVLALSALVDLNAAAPTLGLMIGLAVGIDYALFISVRHKQQLASGMAAEESAARAVATAGSAVVFAGATVMIALGGLAVVGIPFLTTMGLVAAGMVAVAVLIALTLVPAFLGFAGARFTRWPVPGLRRRQAALATKESVGTRWAKAVTARPVPVLLVGVLGLGVLAAPTLDLRLGLPDDGNLTTSTTQRQAYDLLADGFGPGFNGPLTVVVDAVDSPQPREAAEATAFAFTTLPGVAAIGPPVFNPAGTTAIINVVPSAGPADAATKDLVNDIRDLRPGLTAQTGSTLSVTGNTAIGIDISAKLTDALPVFLVVVVGLALLLLTVAFRSLLVPLKATLGFLLSLAATFGALVAVFQWGWLSELIGVQSTGPIMSFLPILMIGLLFGLAMDYEVFLVSRMREEHVHGAEPREAVVAGFRHGARVVTAAALIMAAVFSGFILGGDPTIKSIGFALAFGVAIDAFVVRMTLVPAVMMLLGRRAWYLPRWLDRILPDVDIEGAKLHTLPLDPAPALLPENVVAPAASTTTASPVVLRESSVIHGTVTAAGGGPVPGAVVAVLDEQGQQVGRCPVNPEGGYRITLAVPVPDSTRIYVVLGDAPGWEPTAVALHLEGRETRLDLELTVMTLLLAGTVRDSFDGTPVADATVILLDGHEITTWTTTDASGHYDMPPARATYYTLMVAAAGLDPAALPIAPSAAGDRTTRDLDLAADGTARGIARDPNSSSSA